MFRVLLAILCSINCLVQSQVIDFQACYDAEGQPGRCEPSIEAFSFGKTPTANSTCGSPPANVCIRSVSLGEISSNCTGICDAGDMANAHPPELMTDFVQEQTWWQSENSPESRNPVMFDIPLGSLIEINLISFRYRYLAPRNFRILKSVDYGDTYTDFHYLSTDCLSDYSISSDQILSLSNETSVLCQTIDSPLYPGTITFFPFLSRPSTNDSIPGVSEALYDFITATNIRVILVEHYVIPNLDSSDLGYYYAIRDVSVVGQCQCYGHASQCLVTPGTNYTCICQHNTTGNFCERCSDFYQDVPWQIATGSTAFECIACNCNGHSEQCRFDPEVYEQTNRTSGGVCLNCLNNRTGRQCERCADNFYPVAEADTSFVCTGCGCNPAGVTDSGNCAIEGGSLGDCSCKLNTVGRTCGTCRPGYFNLSAVNDQGCQACECDIDGSLDSTCDPISGVCSCKPNVVGDKCDQCRPNYYLQDPSSNVGCITCNCNIGGSVSTQCDPLTGACLCRDGVQGMTCSEVERDRFFRSVDYLILEGEDATGVPSPVIITDNRNRFFTGTGFYGVEEGSSIADFGSLTPPVNGVYEVVLRYNLQGSVFWNSTTLDIVALNEQSSGNPIDCGGVPEITGSLSVEYTGWSMGIGLAIFRTFCFRAGQSYQFTLRDFVSGRNDNAATLYIDSLVLIPVESSEVEVFEDTVIVRDYRECVDAYRSLVTQASAPRSCELTIFTVSTAVYNGAAACNCDITGTVMGSVCREFGGQCMCLPGVRGRKCDVCSPGFHNLTSSGCNRCSCDALGSSSPLCNFTDGSCTCTENVAGPDCSSCIPDYWGFSTPGGCTRCTCDPTGSGVSQCDELTGQCACRDGVTGESCDRCQNLTFGFSLNGCSMCNCDLAGSTEESCDIDTGQCTCLPTTNGRDCSQCVEGTFNLQSTNPNGCQPCFCSGRSSICLSSPSFYYAILSSMFNRSLEGWEPVDSTSNLPVTLSLGSLPFGDGVTIEADSNAYLSSPMEFVGNRLSSYSQYIQVVLDPVASFTPVELTLDYGIILTGNGVMIGVNMTRTDTGFRVHLHESAGWVYLDSQTSLDAQEFQLILSSLTSILISASYSTDINLYSIVLDTAVLLSEIPDTSDNMLEVTFVESCECPDNYTGLSCEECSSGYTRTSYGTCELCQCNQLSVDCDPITGNCLNCSGSTTGRFCDVCARGTYGDPTIGIECLSCPCPLTSGIGQFSDTCVLLNSGDVTCLNCPPGHTGQQCESCISGYFGDPTGVFGVPTLCSDCLCNGNIDITDPGGCDRLTGVCTGCLNGTTGDQCERCMQGLYGDAVVAKNCTTCDCSMDGSADSICNHLTGECSCLSNVIGQRCDRCQPGYFGFGTFLGCMSCNCSPLGSTIDQCNELGVCECQPGVTGESCDQCLRGFFGLSETGCRACSCSLINSIPTMCDVSDGSCICSPGSTGDNCELCLQNYFQTDSGCTDCPKCYQDIEDQFNLSSLTLLSTETQVQNLMSATSELVPFDQRLIQYQIEIAALEVEASELVSRQRAHLLVYEELLSAINGTLRNRLMQINASLDELRRSFSAVYIVALSSQELMNDIQMEFTTATDIISRIEMVNLPSIMNLSDIVQSNAMQVNITAQRIAETHRNLLMRVSYLRNITYEILSLSNSIIINADILNSLQDEIIQWVNNITFLYRGIDGQINEIDMTLSVFELGVMNITNHLRMKNQSLVQVPDSNEINWLIGNATQTEDFVRNDVLSEIISQTELFSVVNRTFSNNRIEFESLFEEVSDLGVNISSLLDLIRESYREAMLLSLNTQEQISEAEMIAQNLESFSNNTFMIGEEVASAMEDVERINNDSNVALELTRNLEESLRESGEVLGVAKDVAFNASNITAASYEVLSSIDTDSTVASVNTSLQSSIRAAEEINSLSTNVTNDLTRLQNLRDDIVRREADVNAADSLNYQSSLHRDSVRQAITQLRETLDDLEPVNRGELDRIRQLISDVRDEYNAANLSNIYRELSTMFIDQRDTRLQLEMELRGLYEDIEHLRRVNLALPSGCSDREQ